MFNFHRVAYRYLCPRSAAKSLASPTPMPRAMEETSEMPSTKERRGNEQGGTGNGNPFCVNCYEVQMVGEDWLSSQHLPEPANSARGGRKNVLVPNPAATDVSISAEVASSDPRWFVF